MRYCAKCGKKLLEPGEKFCPECGAALSEETPSSAGAKQTSAAALSAKAGKGKQAAGEPPVKNRSGFKTVLAVLGALLFLGFAVLVVLTVVSLGFLIVSGGSNFTTDACANVTCNNYCSGNYRYYSGSCTDGQCKYYYQFCRSGCENGVCNPPTANLSQIYIATSTENTEPYLSAYCDKINPYDLSVREAAAEAIKKHPGAFGNNQLFDIYDWVKANIEYQNVPLAGIPYNASETLATKSGDCKNQAVLIDSMVMAIGGKAKVVVDPACVHAYAIVYFGSSEADLMSFAKAVADHYGYDAVVHYLIYNNSIWVIFDPAGGFYPGDTLANCSGNRTVFMTTSCLDCVNTYPDKPYTYNDMCYSQCPYGTIMANQYACSSCPAGYQSYDNKCVTCPTGKILGSDGLCYPPCGSATTYCPSGEYCYKGHCYRS